MTEYLDDVEPFEPLRPGSRRRLIARVVAPIAWLVAVVLVAVVVKQTNAILIGLIIATGSLVLAGLVLAVLSGLRDRERKNGLGRA